MRRASSFGLAIGLSFTAGCDRKHPPVSSSPPASSPSLSSSPSSSPLSPSSSPTNAGVQVASSPSCKLAAVPLRYPQPKRLVAIGDLHGDLAATRAVLRAAGAIDATDHWSGKDLVVVQTGDVLDRGNDEQAILDLLARLEGEAHAAGGALILLIGNHELMNAAGDLRYVTEGGFTDFDDAPGVVPATDPRIPPLARGRIGALEPGGAYAKRIAQHAVIAVVGDTVFSHAGVLAAWVPQIDAANTSARCWLSGQAGGIDAPPAVLTVDESPVWTRAYGGTQADCAGLAATLTALGATRMVVGHTVQSGGINSLCAGTLWRIDVGLSSAYNGPIQALELSGAAAKILTGSR